MAPHLASELTACLIVFFLHNGDFRRDPLKDRIYPHNGVNSPFNFQPVKD